MSKDNEPLNDFFGIPPREDTEGYDPEIYEIEIPDDPDLDVVTKLALQAYKEQMENVQHVEPKYRQRYLEVAQQYLSLAKDALAKNQELKQKQQKLDKDLDKKDPEGKQKSGMSRKALLEVVKNS